MEFITTFLNDSYEFFNVGFPDWLDALITQLTTYALVATIKTKIYFATIAWEVAQTLLVNLNISSLIQSSWGAIDSTAMSYISAFRLPECLNIMVQGSITSFVIRLLA
jgi:beta-glucanase (GH16 family)